MSQLLSKLLKRTNPDRFALLVPFAKVEKMEDGRLMVEGVATSETLDHSGEIVDYQSAKAAFAEWPGNIREQHDPKKAVGRALEVIADDATKTIRVKAFISKGAPDTQNKIIDGTLTCYSIGGSVKDRKAEKAKGADGKEVDATRLYVKKLTETSVVDEGCNPDTAIALVKSEGDELMAIGLDGGVDAPLDVKGSPDDVAAFAKALNDAGLTMADATALVKAKAAAPTRDQMLIVLSKRYAGDSIAKFNDAEIVKRYGAALAHDKLVEAKKGMWSVQDFANVLSSIAGICRSEQWDAAYEGDNSPIPGALRAWLADGIAIFKTMAAEELNELLAELGGASETVVEAAARIGALRKRLADPDLPFSEFTKIASDHLPADELKTLKASDIGKVSEAIIAKISANAKPKTEELQAAHDHLAALGAVCAGKEAATAPGDLQKVQGEELAKLRTDVAAAGTEHARISAELAAARKDIDMLKAQPVAYVTLRTTPAVKGQERPGIDNADLEPIDPDMVTLSKDDTIIYNPDKSIDYQTSRLIKWRRLEDQRVMRLANAA